MNIYLAEMPVYIAIPVCRLVVISVPWDPVETPNRPTITTGDECPEDWPVLASS